MYFKCECDQWFSVNIENEPVTVICPGEDCGRRWYLHPAMETVHCWNCSVDNIYRVGKQDGQYGHFCHNQNCNQTLRNHPFFGEGKEYDKGNDIKWESWKSLSQKQKNEVYNKYKLRRVYYV